MEAMVRLLQQTQSGALEDERWDKIIWLVFPHIHTNMFAIRDRELGLRLREVMMCLRLPLTSGSEDLRVASLKVVR